MKVNIETVHRWATLFLVGSFASIPVAYAICWITGRLDHFTPGGLAMVGLAWVVCDILDQRHPAARIPLVRLSLNR